MRSLARHIRPGTLCLLALLAALALPRASWSQTSPVYMDDSPRAEAALARSAELASAGNTGEAVRILQDILETEAERVIESRSIEDLFVPVRARIIERLLAEPELLERYRLAHAREARELLAAGELERVERSYFLTEAGFEATLRLAQLRLENAQFEAAWLTIDQLERHPDRRGEGARRALELLRLIAAYAGAGQPPNPVLRAKMIEQVNRWSAGEGRVGDVEPAPRPPVERVYDPTTKGETVSFPGLLDTPLWSHYIGDEARDLPRISEAQREGLPVNALHLDVWPVVRGDIVYASDGVYVTAWNRFTLSQQWKVRLPVEEDGRTRTMGQITVPTLVAVEGDRLIALTRLARTAGNRYERIVASINTETGEVLWSLSLPDLGEPALAEGRVVGPPVIDQGVAIVGVLKDVTDRRLEGMYAIGLDPDTGELLWTRPIGSAGRMPSYNAGHVAASIPASSMGLVFRTDRLGIVSAIESATGRLRWARRAAPEDPYPRPRAYAWNGAGPVLIGEHLVTLSPDQRDILILDPLTGELRGRVIPASALDSPDYLLPAGEYLLGVRDAGVSSIRFADLLENGNPSAATIASVDDPFIRGRVVVADGHVVIPTAESVLVAEAAPDGEGIVHEIPLARTGNVVPLTSQLLVVDDISLHTYLIWDVANGMLRERMEENPADPAPAVTFAELAYRAGHLDQILPAVDHAIDAIERDPFAPLNEDSRARLFRALRDMVRPPAEASDRPVPSDELTEQLLARMSVTAASPMERTEQLILAGDFFMRSRQPIEAVESFQRVLENDLLANAQFTERGRAVLGATAATTRLRDAVRRFGARAYEPYSREAARQLREAGAALDPETFESIARTYPLAPAAVEAWLEAARAYQRQARPHLAVFALESGLDTARHVPVEIPEQEREIAGRLIRALARSGRLVAAESRLTRWIENHPGQRLTSSGETLDAEALLADIREQIRALRRPVIGTEIKGVRQMIGWSIAEAAHAGARLPTDSVMLMSSEGALMLWRDAGGGLEPAWDEAVRREAYIYADGRYAYFSRRVDVGGEDLDNIFVKRRVEDGSVVWETPAIRQVFREMGDRPREQEEENVPPGVRIARQNLHFAFDRNTLALASHEGDVVAFDLISGDRLWSTGTRLRRANAMSLGAGALVLGGPRGGGDETDPPGESEIVVFDARTGERALRRSVPSVVRWLRATEEGRLVVGADGRLSLLDLYRGDDLWASEDPMFSATRPLVSQAGRVIVRDLEDRLLQIETVGSEVRARLLDTRDVVRSSFTFIKGQDLGARAGIATSLGALVYSPEGDLVGKAGGSTTGPIHPPAWAENHFVTLDETPEEDPADIGEEDRRERTALFALHIYSLPSGRLESRALVELGAFEPASRVEVIDGRVLIAMGTILTVIDVPTE